MKYHDDDPTKPVAEGGWGGEGGVECILKTTIIKWVNFNSFSRNNKYLKTPQTFCAAGATRPTDPTDAWLHIIFFFISNT